MKLNLILRATAVASFCCLANAQLVGGGDDCNLPDVISGLGSFSFDNSTATTGTEGQMESACNIFGNTAVMNDVWFDWTATFTGFAIIDTCGSVTDTKIAAYPGAGCPTAGTALDCDDNGCGLQSEIEIPVVSGQVYAIQIGTYPGAPGGTGSLNIAEHVPVPIELVGHWDFSETSGIVVADSSGNSLDATLQGGVTLGHPGAFPSTGTAGLFDASLLGMGVIQDQPPLDTLLEELTLVAWVRTGSPGAPQPRRIFGGDGSAWSAGIQATGLRFSTAGIIDYFIGVSYPLNQWFHVAYVFDHLHDVTCYIDGQPVGTAAGAAPANPSSGQWLISGFRSISAIQCWDGYLDDIQVYQGILTAPEIDYLFQNPGATLAGDLGTQYCAGDGVPPHTLCPCANNNDGSMGGCDWGNPAFPEGGVLDATGSAASMGANDCLLIATGIADNFGIFFGASNAVNGGNGNPLNDGLRCAGGGLVRLIPPTMASGNQATLPAPLQTLDTGAVAGVTRRYQYWFRTPMGPCGQQANLTNGYEILWLP